MDPAAPDAVLAAMIASFNADEAPLSNLLISLIQVPET